MTDDIDVIDQLHRWADHLEARTDTPIVTSPPARLGRPRHGRRLVFGLTAAAAVLALVLAFVVRDAERPSPSVDTTAPPTSPPAAGGDQLPLVGTRWTTQRDAATRVVFEIQRMRDGTGQLVGVIGNDAFCSTLDAVVAIDGQRVRFDDLVVDSDCAGADEVAASLAAVTRWGYGTLDDELFLRNAAGETMLRARGCGDVSCGIDAALEATIDRDLPDLPLEGQTWRLDFRDSGLISVVAFQDDYSYGAFVELQAGQIVLWAGVGGGCMSAEADYSVDGDILAVGPFERTQDDCGPSVSRLVDRLSGEHRFTITGNVLTVAEMQFVGRPTAP